MSYDNIEEELYRAQKRLIYGLYIRYIYVFLSNQMKGNKFICAFKFDCRFLASFHSDWYN